jgi:HKD family nuclease
MFKKIFLLLLLLVCSVSVYNVFKPLPQNLNIRGERYLLPESSVHFFTDRTYVDTSGERYSEQQIFDEVLRMIRTADSYVLVDMFLFNDFLGTATSSYRQLSDELVETLVAKKSASPTSTIQIITDPLNTLYGGYDSTQLAKLTEAGITVTLTDLTKLRDSNPLYSGLWRSILRWLPFGIFGDILPNLLDAQEGDVDIHTYLTMLNFKANHRKVVITDFKREDGSIGMSTLVTSANPHDGSSAHTNTALRIDAGVWKDAVQSEKAVALFSQGSFTEPKSITDPIEDDNAKLTVQFLTENSIEKAILTEFAKLTEGDSFDMAMFYLSDRTIIRALKDADARGVQIRLILDPNKDAFGREKGGVPNRQVANELMQNSQGNTNIRWCDTHGEQCHTKLLIFKHGNERTVIQGSANLTRRNINNFNLETDVSVSGASQDVVFSEIESYFDSSWNNEENRIFTTSYPQYTDSRFLKKLLYLFGEYTGMSSY